ncbi:MAG: protein kinase [bacterium]
MKAAANGVPVAAAPPMTPERWRAVDAILQAALVCDPEGRDVMIADACGSDLALRIEVASLLAAHTSGGDFLERLTADTLGATASGALAERLATALEGRYAIEREIAHGGMARVYLARDLRHDRRVAIKVLREELSAAVGAERFLAEIRVTASLQHPHILPLFDSGSDAGLLWYAMPFVDGETLRARMSRQGAMPVADAVRIAREIAEALDHAHGHGVLHRDVKPENVLLQDGHALVADFGIALALEQAGGERITHTGLALGTPQYMAPEQAAGERHLDVRVDVYALGAVLHEMLAGKSPFAAATRQGVVQRAMQEAPPTLTTRRPEVPSVIASAVRRALAKLPDERFQSAAAFGSALAAPLESAKVDAPATAAPRADPRGRTVSARAAMYVALATLAVGLIGGVLVDRSSLFRRETGAPVEDRPGIVGAPSTIAMNASLTVVDRGGRAVRTIPAERPWTPRFSPDGRRVAYGAFGTGRQTSDLWVTSVDAGTTKRLTDDDADANDPQWSADGSSIAYSARAQGGKDVMVRALNGGGERVLASREGTQFPSDWLRDGSALLVTESVALGHDILVQPIDGSAARPYLATPADEKGARISPDGRWVAYSSDESGQSEVYIDSYPKSGQRATISSAGGVDPVWRGDGRELFYWRDGALLAVKLSATSRAGPPERVDETVLFHAQYDVGVSTMYDVSPDGQRFVIAHEH